MAQTETTGTERTENHIGWFSLAGFVILGALYLGEILVGDFWSLSAGMMLTIVIIAGIGAAALYYGNDPTASGRERIA